MSLGSPQAAAERSLSSSAVGPEFLPLGVDVAIDEFDHRHRGRIAVAEARLHHPRIAAIACLVARTEHVEELLHHGDVANLGNRLPAGVQAAALAQGHQLLDDRPQVLRLGQRRDDLLVLDQGGRHIGEHRAPMLGGAVQLAVGKSVAHRLSSCSSSFRTPRSGDPESSRQRVRTGFRVRALRAPRNDRSQ